jgi:flagellar basal-body rod protein FlgB
MPNVLFDPTLAGLAQALTLHQRRHEILTSNLANLETPGYRAQELDFSAALTDAFASAASEGPTEAVAAPAPQVVEDTTAPPRADGNTVDLDLQMTKLGANGSRYVALARILGLRLALLRQAIEGSR